MVDINELYITPDNKKMIIDVSVRDNEYHKNAYITEIVLDTQDTFVPEIGSPSSEWIAKRPVDIADSVAKIAWETKRIDEYLDLVCPCKHHIEEHHHHHKCHCHHHHHDPCGCHHHKDICTHRTGGTGHYSNPYIVQAIDVEKGIAIDTEGNKITLEKGDYVKIDKNSFDRVDFLNDAEYSGGTLTITESAGSNDGEGQEDGKTYVYNGESLEDIPEVTDPTKIKHIRVEINQEDICQPFTDTMFFVWIKCEGVDPEAPCSLNREYTLGVCINQFTIYRRFICLMEELLKDCDIPKHFIDLYLRWQAVKMAISTGNYAQAILLWKRFFLFQHQRPLWESPQYDRFWANWLKDGLLPESNYPHPVYGWGGSFFNQQGNYCRTCRR